MYYTVRQVACISHVSVRTLHYYDELGLLPPRVRSGSGYRLYGEAELVRLKRILFLREIGPLLDGPLDEWTLKNSGRCWKPKSAGWRACWREWTAS